MPAGETRSATYHPPYPLTLVRGRWPTAPDEIATAVTKLEHANVTMVPFQMGETVPTPVP